MNVSNAQSKPCPQHKSQLPKPTGNVIIKNQSQFSLSVISAGIIGNKQNAIGPMQNSKIKTLRADDFSNRISFI